MTEKPKFYEPLTDEDLSMQLFMAQMANDEGMVEQIERMMEAINIARSNKLRVDIYRSDEGEMSYQVKPKAKTGFPTPDDE